MAAPCNSELPSEASSCLKIPKSEVLSPPSPGLSDGNRSLSNPSTPSRSSPLSAGVTGGGAAPAGLSGASPSVSFSTACRGMSWTPAETNALIAVWGNERLVEARYQQLEGAGTIFGTKAPGPAMYDRVSRALAELGYERTPSQCRERMKVTEAPPLPLHCVTPPPPPQDVTHRSACLAAAAMGAVPAGGRTQAAMGP